MLITKKDLDIINDFVEHNKSMEGFYKFPHIEEELSDFLKEPVEFYVRNYYKDYQAQISTQRLSLTIVKEHQFVWEILLRDTSLQGYMDAQHLINLIADHKITLTELYNSIVPEVKRLIMFDELYNSSRWGLDNLNNFYRNFSSAHSDLDTKVALKILYKMKFEEWDENVSVKCHDGKRESIDYYRRLFDNFAKCVEQIKNLQLHDIPA